MVDEVQGIYREEVLAMMGSLADIHVAVHRILGYSKARTMGKKRKIFRTPEERAP